MNRHTSNKIYWPALAAMVALYLALSFYQLDLPGLHYDEAFEAVPAVQLLQGLPVTAFRDSGLTIGGQTYPLMTQDYIGAINTYLALPFIAALGATPTALRAMSVLVGSATLLLTALLARRLTGRAWVGLLAALLLAVDPTFIFWNRQGVFVTAVTATLGVGATYCWLRRWQGGHWRWSAAGAFLFGLGVYAKFLFVWLIFALAGAALLLSAGWLIRRRRALLRALKTLLFPEGAAAVAAFLAGCGPLLLYNLQTGGTFISITDNAATSYYGVNNLAFIDNLLVRLSQLMTLLSGSHFWYLGAVITNPVAPVVGVGLTVLIVIFAIRNSSPQTPETGNLVGSPGQVALFPLLVVALVTLGSIGTVSALWITHFAILMPWPALVIATGSWLVGLHAVGRWGRAVTYAVAGAILLLLAINGLNVMRYHRALSESGGLSAHSDAVYDLSHWLDAHAEGVVVAMDWGLAAPVVYLTNGRVNAVEVFGYQWQPDVQLTTRLQRFIDQPTTLYLWRAPDEIIFDRSDEFQALYRPRQLQENIEAAFYERSGRPILGVTRLVAAGTATNPPQ